MSSADSELSTREAGIKEYFHTGEAVCGRMEDLWRADRTHTRFPCAPAA